MAVSIPRMVLAFSNPFLQTRKQPDYIHKHHPADPEIHLKPWFAKMGTERRLRNRNSACGSILSPYNGGCLEKGSRDGNRGMERAIPTKAISVESLASTAVELQKQGSSETENTRAIADCWRELQGENNWAGLLDPIDPLLRSELIKYGSKVFSLFTDTKANCDYVNYSVREQVLAEIYRLVNETYADEEVSITITGHSLGSALALLAAYDIAETVVNKRKDDGRNIPVTAFTFAGPRVGNNRFKQRLEQLGVKVLRVVNVHDVVPKSPGFFFNERTPSTVMKLLEHFPWGTYTHVGVELQLDHKVSPFLRPEADLVCAHNQEGYLHVLNGYHGKGKKFEPACNRDPALVNKSSDILKDDLEIMTNWMQYHNKGMTMKNGRYMQTERNMEDHLTEHNPYHIQQIRAQRPESYIHIINLYMF